LPPGPTARRSTRDRRCERNAECCRERLDGLGTTASTLSWTANGHRRSIAGLPGMSARAASAMIAECQVRTSSLPPCRGPYLCSGNERSYPRSSHGPVTIARDEHLHHTPLQGRLTVPSGFLSPFPTYSTCAMGDLWSDELDPGGRDRFLPFVTGTATSSPRLTRANGAWRETASSRIASRTVRQPSPAFSLKRAMRSSLKRKRWQYQLPSAGCRFRRGAHEGAAA
jgi:hypothetical protein